MSSIFSLKVSVKALIEYSLRSGSIDFRSRAEGSAKASERAKEGIAMHKIIQKAREVEAQKGGWIYRREVKFVREFERHGLKLTVNGRADGIIEKDGMVTIEEIKTTYVVPEALSENKEHCAQAMCYAYFYALETPEPREEKTKIAVQITYFDVSSQETTEFVVSYGFDELHAFFEDILDKYAAWTAFLLEKRLERDESASSLEFPFSSYRKMQKHMCALVYKAIDENLRVFINAPTGTGKTISTLFPAVKALSRKKADKIFYLTAKSAAASAAIDASRLMEAQGLKAKTLVITSKDKSCVFEKPLCEPISCPRAGGHYDRLNDALFDIIKNENIFDYITIFQYAEKHSLCPYEYALELASIADVIICDYNYAFDPNVYLRRFFSESPDNYVFLIDEAHNLVDRAREMYSAKLSVSTLSSYSKRLSESAKGVKSTSRIKQLIKAMIKEIKALSKKIAEGEAGISFDFPPRRIDELASEYRFEAEKWFANDKNDKASSFYEAILELYFLIEHFIYITEIYNEKYVCYCESSGKETIFKLFCADPSENLSHMLDNAVAAVFFSATLIPAHYFKSLLGGREHDLAVALPNPFPPENLKVVVTAQISAKYDKRSLFYDDIADCIHTAVTISKGSYLAFFPSYAYMRSVYDVFYNAYPEIDCVCQNPEMTETQKNEFLDNFNKNDSLDNSLDATPFVAFAVLGGSFSEAIDLPGKKLIGAFIISVGLPQICFERLMMANYFNHESDDDDGTSSRRGFSYAYVYPGMNKVLQAAGRVIRTSTDKGIIVLMDERFSFFQYSSLFPESFRGYEVLRTKSAFAASLRDFWRLE